MPFHFSLEGVLRFRCSLERREYRRLQLLLSSRSDLLREIDDLKSTRLRLLRDLQDTLESAPVAGAELGLAATRSEAAGFATERLQLQLQKLGNEIRLQTERYHHERQQREVLETLRDRQLRQYQEVQQRREQAALDELHLIRRSRTRQPLPN